jgi:hypothetical protein
MSAYSHSNTHNYNNPGQSGGGGRGVGPIMTLPAGNYQVALKLDGPGTIQLKTVAGAVLASGPGGHRGGPLNLGAATQVQLVVTASNLDLVRSSGCVVSLVTPGGSRGELSWSE